LEAIQKIKPAAVYERVGTDAQTIENQGSLSDALEVWEGPHLVETIKEGRKIYRAQ
jgi:hypothetical protein